MKRSKKRRNVVRFRNSHNKANSVVPNVLYLVQEILTTAKKKRVAIIKT